MQEDAAVNAIRGLTTAVHDVADAVHARHDDEHGYRGKLRTPWALELAFRFCRFRDEEGVWHGLAEHTKRVPDEHVSKACTIGRGPECWVVQCACGQTEFVAAALVECRGDCGRWFAADEWGPWALRLPEQEAVAA